MVSQSRFAEFSNIIRKMDLSNIKQPYALPKELELDRDGKLSINLS